MTHRPSRALCSSVLCLLLIAPLGAGCATVAGTVAGPVTGPLHAHEFSRYTPPWFMPFAYVLSVPLGALMGMITGVAADVGFVLSGGEYGANGHPRFCDVFHPISGDWGRYQPVDVLGEHNEPVRAPLDIPR